MDSGKLTRGHFSGSAAELPGDPAVDDWGVPAAVVARMTAVVAELDVCHGVRAGEVDVRGVHSTLRDWTAESP